LLLLNENLCFQLFIRRAHKNLLVGIPMAFANVLHGVCVFACFRTLPLANEWSKQEQASEQEEDENENKFIVSIFL